MSVLNDVCKAIAVRAKASHPKLDARPHPGGALRAPAFYLVVSTFPTRTTSRKRDWTLRGVLVLGDLGEEAVRQGREYMETLPAAIEGTRDDYDGLVDSVTVSNAEEIGGDDYQQLPGWACAFEIEISGRTG